MALRLKGSSSGYAEIDAAAVAGDVTLTLPSTTGTINVKDGSGTTNVGTGVNLGNPGANIFTISNTGGERLRIDATGAVTIPGNLNISGVLTYEDVTSVDAIGLSTFRDGLITKDVGIATITSSVSDTAVDVFVYDTSKDSDGGAWRRRTSYTSWYNETLGTSDRGTRKEFPAVAMIVATEDDIIIYDGDDPDLPMWMIFESSDTGTPYDTHYLGRGSGFSGFHPSITSVAMLNGILVVGKDGDSSNYAEAYTEIRFISDSALHRDSGSSVDLGNAISGRNGSAGGRLTNSSYGSIVDHDINDVAMTVLPNAPIDSATGLPVPTIAVATNRGVSVIKDDGTVISTTSQPEKINTIEFTEDYGINAHIDASTDANKALVYIDDINKIDGLAYNSYGNWDGVLWQSRYASNVLTFLTPNAQSASYPISDFVSLGNRSAAIGSNFSDGGLTILEKEKKGGDMGQGMVAFASTSYNTGYMHGDIKGALLSDTSTSFTYGSELLTNGTFDSDISGWTLFNSILSHRTDAIRVADNGSYSKAYQSFTTVVGKEYLVKVVVKTIEGGAAHCNTGSQDPADASGNDFTIITNITATGTYYNVFTANATTTYIEVWSDNIFYVEYSELSVKENAPGLLDRSVNNNGLIQYGTITKTAVAGTGDTAAELVGYSNFSASNYLQQPYNSDLAPGTAAYSVSCWFKTGTSSSDQYIFDRNHTPSNSSSSRNLLLIMSNGASGSSANKFQFWHRGVDGVSTNIQITDKTVTDNNWHQVVALNDGTTYRVYVDGEASSVTGSVIKNVGNDQSPPMFVGVRHSLASPMTGSMALFRYSLSAPSPEQIKKMYNDEKVLFQENAKCTLHGSSDAVTALAYDEVTDQLHVGTSSGRSDFQGLRRINNTTQQVQTAISAHDTFIIEQ